jgi:phosphoribosylformylglycinamidine synthase
MAIMVESAAKRPFLRVEVFTRAGFPDAAAKKTAAEVQRLLGRPLEVELVRGYSLEFERLPDAAAAREKLHAVLADPVLHESQVLRADDPVPAPRDGWRRVDVVRRPGVMDPTAASVQRALAAVGLEARSVRTYRAYLFRGARSSEELARVGQQLLANLLIEEVRVDPRQAIAPFVDLAKAPARRVEVKLRGASDAQLAQVSKDGLLALDVAEMRAIADWFQKEGREPTDVELETLAQTWSEHCKHKTLTSAVEVFEEGGAARRYDNLLKDTIFAATKQLNRDWCLSVFQDNAGVVAFDDELAVTFKVETHNHPSALEPYGGAGTGVGGVIRDTLGTGLGAKPILSTDVFCVGPLELTSEQLPAGTLPPRRILQGIVAGVRDYGNRMGIPTPSGAIFVHEEYRTNPLVFCGSVGLIPRDKIAKAARKGDRIFVLGGRTGRDGIHGATFSSLSLDSSSSTVASGAVQIGNAIEEKKVLDALLDARDRGWFTAVTDCGAGGLSSAIGEMGEALGASVELAKVPLKYDGLTPGEIWISEAQERMVVAVKPEHARDLEALCKVHQVEATDLGTFTGDGRLHLTFDGTVVADLAMEFVHHGLPRRSRRARVPAAPKAATTASPTVRAGASGGASLDANTLLERLLASPDVTSKEEVVRQYDHEVLAGSAIKPMVGRGGFGPSDACVVAPRLGSKRGIAVASGLSTTTGALDPYRMALLSIDEAVRNVVCVGGRFDRIALLDNFAWPSVDDEETLGTIVRAAEACRDAALAYGTPFVSGKDSLHNQTKTKDGVVRIPPTLLVSAITLLDDVTRAVSMDAKAAEHRLVLVGTTRDELAGSHLLQLLECDAATRELARATAAASSLPSVDLASARRLHESVAAAIGRGLVRSCHDLCEGGLAVAVAETCLAGGLGATLCLGAVPRPKELGGVAAGGAREASIDDDLTLLFSESAPRYLLEVAWDDLDAVDALFATAGVAHAIVGTLTAAPTLVVSGTSKLPLVNVRLDRLTKAFRTGLGI